MGDLFVTENSVLYPQWHSVYEENEAGGPDLVALFVEREDAEDYTEWMNTQEPLEFE